MKNSSSTQPDGRLACNTAMNADGDSATGTGPSTVGTHANPLIPERPGGDAPTDVTGSDETATTVNTHPTTATTATQDRGPVIFTSEDLGVNPPPCPHPAAASAPRVRTAPPRCLARSPPPTRSR